MLKNNFKKNVRIFSASILFTVFGVFNVVYAATGSDQTTRVSTSGHVIKYIGYISAAGVDKFEKAYASDPHVDTLEIGSPGGVIKQGIRFGKFVHEHHLNVRVYKFCASSCANYVFPAGNRKILTQHAVLLFHGGACTLPHQVVENGDLDYIRKYKHTNLWPQRNKQISSDIRQNMAQCKSQLDYYKTLGIAGDWPAIGQSNFCGMFDHFKPEFWFYTIPSMSLLGVKNVSVENGKKWEPRLTLSNGKVVPMRTVNLEKCNLQNENKANKPS